MVLTEDAWEAFYGGDPDIVGQTLRIGSVAFTVVGVASNALAGPAYDPDLWVAFSQTAQLVAPDGVDVLKSATYRAHTTVGRLRPPREARQLEALLEVATEQLRREDAGGPSDGAWRIDAQPVNRVSLGPTTHDTRTRLLAVLAGLTAGFLVAACSNITLLMVTRVTDRSQELAVRSALGATTATLVRLFAWEVVLLVALGSGVAIAALPWIGRLAAMPQLARLVPTTGIDRYAVATAVVIAVGVAVMLVVGTAVGLDVRSRWHGVGVSHGARVTRRARLRQVLVVAQVALSCVLLMAAGLLAQSVRAVAGRPTGFVPDVLVARLIMPSDRYLPRDGSALYERVRTNLLNQSAVSAAGLAWHAPLSETALSVSVSVPGAATEEPAEITGNFVSPGYFESIGVPVLDGRGFLLTDDVDAPLVVIVNRSFAERAWPDRQAVGRELILPRSGGRRRVIGVVDDVRFRTLTEPTRPLVYLPLTQRYQPWAFVHVRTRTDDPMRALAVVRSVVGDLDPQIGVAEPRTLEDDVQALLAEWRGPASLSGLLAIVTLLLTTGGVYATLASSVSQRTKEIAIRRALGAQDRHVRRLVIRQGFAVAAIGIVVGVGATVAVMRYVESLLYGVTSDDVTTQLVVVGVLAFVTFLSCSGPARRAARADPIMALRAE